LLKCLAAYLRQRLTTLSAFCVICDRTHVFSGSNMMMPSVCSRELCVFRFQKLDVAKEMATSVAIQTGVIDLLVSIAKAAALSQRWNVIFKPFPMVFDSQGKLRLDPEKPDVDVARQVLKAMPSVQATSSVDSVADLQTKMDAAHPLANAMFQWIVSSNKAYIVKLPTQSQFTWMGTKHQFIFVTSNPQREAEFNALKQKHGSSWAFHGSRAENWHSILRNGLRNASGTALQVNGTAYGNGIYCSPNASTSFGYSLISGAATNKAAHDREEYIDVDSMLCIAMCEVVEKDIRKSGTIWVQPEENCVLTRYLLVYTHGYCDGHNVDLTDKAKMAQLSAVAASHA
jgi:poly [ADP-ribose] polymerase 6/8